MNNLKYIQALLLLLISFTAMSYGQASAQEEAPPAAAIMMRSEIRPGSASLRWAPTNARTWQLLNQYGVRLERHTLVRDGELLDHPEVLVLSERLIPKESDEFIRIATEYPFAAIIAQAIFGESFVVAGAGTGEIERIIALSEEMQQRFAFSLYAADLCFTAARAVGWGWEDNTIKENERYLYRVVPLLPADAETVIESGAQFVDPERLDIFPAPLDFTAQFMDGSALISWNARIMEALYAAYRLERSTDGVHFAPVTEVPITQIDTSEENDMIFHVNPIENNITYHYRLVGLTIFGTHSEYTDTLSGMGVNQLRNPPFLSRAIPDASGGVVIEWEFDVENEALIESFTLERSDDNRDFYDLITPIDKTLRSITVPDVPITANYFAITANTLAGSHLRSFSALVQPVDSIPPAAPVGLTAIVDSTGVVTLSWQANTDRSSYGYRLFRGRTAEEELIPLNDTAWQDTVFVDSVNLWTLNHSLFYSVAALNERYTMSDRSEVIQVRLPEVIPPTAPFIQRVRTEDGSNVVVWVSGGEETLAGFYLYRLDESDMERGFELIALINGAETIEYTDRRIKNNQMYVYRIHSRSEGGLLSEPSPDYRVRAIRRSVVADIEPQFDLVGERDRIRISWNVSATDVTNILLYRRVGDGQFSLLREGLSPVGEMEVRDIIPGVRYEYMLVVRSGSALPVNLIKDILL